MHDFMIEDKWSGPKAYTAYTVEFNEPYIREYCLFFGVNIAVWVREQYLCKQNSDPTSWHVVWAVLEKFISKFS